MDTVPGLRQGGQGGGLGNCLVVAAAQNKECSMIVIAATATPAT